MYSFRFHKGLKSEPGQTIKLAIISHPYRVSSVLQVKSNICFSDAEISDGTRYQLITYVGLGIVVGKEKMVLKHFLSSLVKLV